MVVVAIVFGVAMSVLKGNDAGTRDTIGNVSAPWLLLPFVAAAVAGGRRIVRGALVGTATLMAALVGFYVTNTFVLDLGGHPWLVDLRLTLAGGELYFALAVVGGPTFGALGSAWQRRRSTVLGVVVAALLVFEPVGWLLYGRAAHVNYLTEPAVWVGEAIIGVGACIVAGTVARPSSPVLLLAPRSANTR